MPDYDQTIARMIQRLPMPLQNRFTSLGGYVRGLVEEEEQRLKRKLAFGNNDIQLIQLAAFVYLLDYYFREGTRAAASAALMFEEYHLSGFSVGSTVFTRNNENTRRGALLAYELRQVLADTPIAVVIEQSTSVRALVSRMIREMSNG